MLSKLKVQHYKSLFDTEIDLEPLTVFIGPNGSGKSNICEALAILSDFLQRLVENGDHGGYIEDFFPISLMSVGKNKNSNIESKFWHGELNYLTFEVSPKPVSSILNTKNLSASFYFIDQCMSLKISNSNSDIASEISDPYSPNLRNHLISNGYLESAVKDSLKKVRIYDFSPGDLSKNLTSASPTTQSMASVMERTGQGIAYALVDILHANRKGFDELEERLTNLVPNIKRILLPRSNSQTFSLELTDKYSDHHIPASEISDGTLRILAFLTALYQEDTPSIICFEEIENGVHPWLLHKMMELLKIVSTEGITGKPVQVLITTHSPVLLNYVEPYQVRAVELNAEGKTQVHALPIDSVRFQKALEAYDGSLGELWFTNVFGGNPA
jgi:predicted ATPase